MESATIDVWDHPTRIQRGGAGRQVLLLHGEGGTWEWGAFHEAPAPDFDVIAPVHPGFAGEELPEWVRGVDDLVFHYVDLIAAVDLHRPLVVGISLGGWIALDLAMARPDLVGGLVLVGGLGLRPSDPVPDLFIKPLRGPLSAIPGLSGYTVLGDGRLVFLLDPPTLLTA